MVISFAELLSSVSFFFKVFKVVLFLRGSKWMRLRLMLIVVVNPLISKVAVFLLFGVFGFCLGLDKRAVVPERALSERLVKGRQPSAK